MKTKLGLLVCLAALGGVACSGGSGEGTRDPSLGAAGAGGDEDAEGTGTRGKQECVAPKPDEFPSTLRQLQVRDNQAYALSARDNGIVAVPDKIVKMSTDEPGEFTDAYTLGEREFQGYSVSPKGLFVLEHATPESGETTENFVYQVPASGGAAVLVGPKSVAGYGSTANLFLVDDLAAYVATHKAFYRIDLGTGSETRLAEHGRDATPRLQVVNNSAWYTDSLGQSIYRLALDGGEQEPSIVYEQGCDFGVPMLVTHYGIYCGGPFQLELLELDGSGRRTVFKPENRGFHLNPSALDGDELYLDGDPNQPAYRMKLLNHGREGSTMSVVACDGVSINDLAFTPTRLLWLGTGTSRADLSLMSLYTLTK